MRIQDFIANNCLGTFRFLIHSAKRTPEDKLNWRPFENGRSVIEQLQECAQCPEFYIGYLNPELGYTYPEAETLRAERKNWTTLEECERIGMENSQKIAEVIRAMPDERLDERHKMPWGEEMRLVEIAEMHAWNNTYHLGQINYIQTLLGDMEMM